MNIEFAGQNLLQQHNRQDSTIEQQSVYSLQAVELRDALA